MIQMNNITWISPDNFYIHEAYVNDKMIADIFHDDDLTQPWVVSVGGKEIWRSNTLKKCQSYVEWHFSEGTLSEVIEQKESQLTIKHIDTDIARGEVFESRCDGKFIGYIFQSTDDDGDYWHIANDDKYFDWRECVVALMRQLKFPVPETVLAQKEIVEPTHTDGDPKIQVLSAEKIQRMFDAKDATAVEMLDIPSAESIQRMFDACDRAAMLVAEKPAQKGTWAVLDNDYGWRWFVDGVRVPYSGDFNGDWYEIDGIKYMSKAGLKREKLTESGITKLFPEHCTTAPNPHHSKGAPMKLYSLDRVNEVLNMEF
jgi:hypothetical protein